MLYDILEKLNISYQEIEHEAFYTVEDAKAIQGKIEGVGCKNLFLTDGHRYFLYILKDDKQADLKGLAKFLQVSRLSFASEEKLLELLHLTPGSVSPFGVMYDLNRQVSIFLDDSLVGKRLLFHPNINTKTLSISCDDLMRFFEYVGHSYTFVNL